MSLFACRYAVVQFLPYAETGEFANVGVALLCPETGYFGFRLQTARRTKRITGFFERLDRAIYTRALDVFQQELQRVAQHFDAPRTDPDAARQLFAALTHPREAIIRFAPVRAIMTGAPDKEVEALFGRYVEHDFATPEHKEEVLEKRIGQLLRSLPLDKPFQAHTIGNDETRARFPFVIMDNERPLKAIKPLFLAQDEPHKIFEHADYWLPKMRRLRARGLLPETTLISTEAPPEADDKRFKAYVEVRDELIGLHLLTASTNDEEAIRRFALAQ
ncbi:MAG: DUF3037 domain-containing protein [Azonexus sp.]